MAFGSLDVYIQSIEFDGPKSQTTTFSTWLINLEPRFPVVPFAIFIVGFLVIGGTLGNPETLRPVSASVALKHVAILQLSP